LIKQCAEERSGLDWAAAVLSLAAQSVFQLCTCSPALINAEDTCKTPCPFPRPFGGLLGESAFLLLPMFHLRKIKGEILGKEHVPVQISEGSPVSGCFV